MHGQYLKDLEGKANKKPTWSWLRSVGLKKLKALFQWLKKFLPTNCMKAKIKPLTNNINYHFSSKKNKTINHLINCCSKISQTDYKQYYVQIARIIGNFARHLNLNAIKSTGTIKLRIGKMSGLSSYGTFISKPIDILFITCLM